MATETSYRDTIGRINFRTAAKALLQLIGILAAAGSAFILYATAMLIVNESFLRWGAFEDAGRSFALVIQFAFQVPLVGALGAAAAWILNIFNGEKCIRRRDAAFVAIGLYALVMSGWLWLIDFGVI